MTRQINTSRLLLRDPAWFDLKAVHDLLMLPASVRFNPSGYPKNILTTEEMITGWIAQANSLDRTSYLRVIELTEEKTFIGIISLELGKRNYHSAEIWFKLSPEQWNKGYASEALAGIVKFGFTELNLHRMEAGCSTFNPASARVLEKAGMRKEGVKRKNLPLEDGWHDSYQFGILKEDWVSAMVQTGW